MYYVLVGHKIINLNKLILFNICWLYFKVIQPPLKCQIVKSLLEYSSNSFLQPGLQVRWIMRNTWISYSAIKRYHKREVYRCKFLTFQTDKDSITKLTHFIDEENDLKQNDLPRVTQLLRVQSAQIPVSVPSQGIFHLLCHLYKSMLWEKPRSMILLVFTCSEKK